MLNVNKPESFELLEDEVTATSDESFETLFLDSNSVQMYIENEYGLKLYDDASDKMIFDTRTSQQIDRDRKLALQKLNALSDFKDSIKDVNEADPHIKEEMENIRYLLCVYDDHKIEIGVEELANQLDAMSERTGKSLHKLHCEIGKELDQSGETIKKKITHNTFTVREARLLWHKLSALYVDIGVSVNEINDYQKNIKGEANAS